MSNNVNLSAARAAKKDEFYTQLSDIEKELKHYREHFRGKVVYCNCDDPERSNFYRFFAKNFDSFGLKKLITTHYEHDKPSYKLELTKADVIKTPLQQNGDFRSPECVEILKEADIVVTNHPFSLFREYIGQLMQYKKKFVVVGNVNAITYKEFFPLLKEGKVWLGPSIHSGDRWFEVPDSYPLTASNSKIENGKKFVKVKGVRWFTNLDHKERHESLILYKPYDAEEYPTYDNYDAINVNKTKDIPYDYLQHVEVPIEAIDDDFVEYTEPLQYASNLGSGVDGKFYYTVDGDIAKVYVNDSTQNTLMEKLNGFECKVFNGVMGVPITFLDKYCPEQFEIVDANMFRANESVPFKKHGLVKDKDSAINGKPIYARILIRRS